MYSTLDNIKAAETPLPCLVKKNKINLTRMRWEGCFSISNHHRIKFQTVILSEAKSEERFKNVCLNKKAGGSGGAQQSEMRTCRGDQRRTCACVMEEVTAWHHNTEGCLSLSLKVTLPQAEVDVSAFCTTLLHCPNFLSSPRQETTGRLCTQELSAQRLTVVRAKDCGIEWWFTPSAVQRATTKSRGLNIPVLKVTVKYCALCAPAPPPGL